MKCKKPNIRKLQLAIVSLVSFALLMWAGWYILVIVLAVSLVQGRIDKGYVKSIGIYVDDFGGSLFYGTRGHTISANIGLRMYRLDRFHTYFGKAVDYFFGTNHCMCLALEEGLIDLKDGRLDNAYSVKDYNA